MKITLHLGSPPHLSNRAFDRPQDRDESVASTTLGPGYDRSSSLTDVTRRTGASCEGDILKTRENKERYEKKRRIRFYIVKIFLFFGV